MKMVVKMEKAQQSEWAEAQKITFSVDLVEAAKKMLKFLLVVDQNRVLYEDFALQWATYRYNAFWLPLLAKHVESPVFDGPLVVPLDCEWVWHCHRLNPLRYKFDCEKLFGRVLDYQNVVSSFQATSKSETEAIWSKLYPEEPYELDVSRPFSPKGYQNAKFTRYDLVDAVKRQTRFTYQVSRSHTFDDIFLQEAEARYKGFLHLVRTNEKKRTELHCVPTYDIDLMWHTHQLHHHSYSKDMTEIVGRVLHHDDTIADETKEKQLEAGSFKTTSQWEDMFGLRYWKAGAMHRGVAPTPVTQVPIHFNVGVQEFSPSGNCLQPIQFPTLKAVEVFLEFVEIKNVPKEHVGNLSVCFSKKQHDKLFKAKRSLSILSESAEKQVAYFQCEPTGEFLLELVSSSPSNDQTPKTMHLLGSCSLSLQELITFGSQLSAEKWLSVESDIINTEPILLHAAISFTPPVPVPQAFHLAQSQPLSEVNDMIHRQVVDDDGKNVFSLQMGNISPDSSKEVFFISASGEKNKVAEFMGDYWSINGTQGSFKLQHNSGEGDHLFELVGNKMVKLYSGRRLDFEPKHYVDRRLEQAFMTAVEFSRDHPYGRAVALIDLHSETIKVMDEWIILPSIALGFILSYTFKGDGQIDVTSHDGNMVNNCGKCDGSGMACGHVNTLANGEFASHYSSISGKNGNNVGARCWCLTEAASSSVNETCDSPASNVAARCWCLTEAAPSVGNEKCGRLGNNVAARCWCIAEVASSVGNEKCGGPGSNVGARCWCIAEVAPSVGNEKCGGLGSNVGARCWCIAEVAPSVGNEKCGDPGSNVGARCWCIAEVAPSVGNEKCGGPGSNVGARCWCIAEVAPSVGNEKCGGPGSNVGARCWCIAEVAPSILSEPVAV